MSCLQMKSRSRQSSFSRSRDPSPHQVVAPLKPKREIPAIVNGIGRYQGANINHNQKFSTSSSSRIPVGVPVNPPTQSISNRHVLDVKMFDKELLYDIFNLAETFRLCVVKEQPLDHILKVGL